MVLTQMLRTAVADCATGVRHMDPALVVILLEGAGPLFEALALIDELAADTHSSGGKSAASAVGAH